MSDMDNFLRQTSSGQYNYNNLKISNNPVTINQSQSVVNSQTPELSDSTEDGKTDKSFDKKEVAGIAVATALAAAVLGGAVMSGRTRVVIERLSRENDSFKLKNSTLESAVEDGLDKIKNLTEDNSAIKKLNQQLKEEIAKTKDRFADIFEGDLSPKKIRDEIYNKLKGKINKGKVDYDILNPPVTGKGAKKVYEDAVSLPEFVPTSNRAHIRKLDIPEIRENGSFDFKLPDSKDVKISHMQTKNFTPVKNQLTNISENYADSVQWNNDKIARDVLQNFFDGHGQTLDGVQLKFSPTKNGKFKVQILGKSTYTPDKAIYIGESTKRNNAKAAGNYGEGLKMSVLKLLKDSGADEVNIGSDNWRLTYNLAEGNISDKRVLSYSIDKVDKFNGNYMEFETSDKGLLSALRESIDRFYHSGNEHFKCPDFENEIVGIKKLKPNEKGGIYIAGQRFEFDGSYEGLNGAAIFLKEKPPVDILDPSRDRVSLNTSQLESIAVWLSKDSRTTKDDKIKILQSLEPYWNEKSYLSESPLDKFVNKFINYLNIYGGDKLHINFPEKYVAYSDASNDIVRDLKMNGYTVCKDSFSNLGMQTIRDLMGDARAHEVVAPDEVQTKKILILKEALNSLKTSLEKHFSPEEIDAKIYLFDNKSVKDSKLYSDAAAEAITDSGVTKGFWMDKSYLDKSSLSDALETALHELSHKVGGDETAEFSYKLTDVNRRAIEHILNDIKSRTELQALNQLWSELG